MEYSEREKQKFLSDIESKLIPKVSFGLIVDGFKNELKERLIHSDNSMLPTFLEKIPNQYVLMTTMIKLY